MRILFAGTPEIAVPTLRNLASHYDVVAVLTAPDRPAGRGRAPESQAVKTAALELGLQVIQPERLGSDARTMVAESGGADLLVCVAYGRIFGPKFLGQFPRGGINLHPSLLPRHRGPAPIPAAILAGDRETGVTVQILAEEMDAGDILAQTPMAIAPDDTTETLSVRAAEVGAQLVLESVRAIDEGRSNARPQNAAEATYSRIIAKDDGRIDWSQPADRIERMVRAYYPWPGAFTSVDGRLLTIIEASAVEAPEPVPPGAAPGTVLGVDKRNGILVQTGIDGGAGGMPPCVLAVRKLQLQAKKPLDWKSFMNGMRDFPGTVLGG